MRWGLLPLLALALCACGDDDESGVDPAWAGTWQGTMDCRGYVDNATQTGPVQGTVDAGGQFDEDGHLLMPTGNRMVPQTRQGQVDQWVPEGGGAAERTLTTFQANGDHRIYVFKETIRKSDRDGSITYTTHEKYDVRRDGDSIRGTYELEYTAVGHGSYLARAQEEYTCNLTFNRR